MITALIISALALLTTALAKLYKFGPFLEADLSPVETGTPKYTPPVESTPTEPYTQPQSRLQRIYEVAKLCLGERLTLNPSVPKELGCVQAVSYVLLHAQFDIPQSGIDGVNALIEWMLKNGFKEVSAPQKGAIVTAHRPKLSDPTLAHAGICGLTHIMSNTSFTDPSKQLVAGLFQANYSYASWNSYYSKNGLSTRYFVPCA